MPPSPPAAAWPRAPGHGRVRPASGGCPAKPGCARVHDRGHSTDLGRPPGARRGGPASPAGTLSIPASARQLVVVSSPTYDPADYLATFQSFRRANASSPWEPVFPAWQAEIGSGHIVDVRHEGDHATPTGVYPFGLTMYGTRPDPGGLHAAYHQSRLR